MGACNKEAAPQQKICDDNQGKMYYSILLFNYSLGDVSVCNHVQGPEHRAKSNRSSES